MNHHEAMEWFITNFVVNPTSQNFVRLANGLIEPTPSQRKNLLSYRGRNRRNDFTFMEMGNFVAIVPKHEQAAWAKGVIFYDEIMGNYRFVSGDVMLDMTPKAILNER